MVSLRPQNLINRRKKIIFLIVLISIAGYFGGKTFGNRKQTPHYQTAGAEKGTLVVSVSASGNITTGGLVNVSTEASGTVSKIYVKNAEAVSQGQAIAELTLDLPSQRKAAAAWLDYQAVSGTVTAPISGILNNLTIAPGSVITSPTASSANNSSQTSTKIASITLPKNQLRAVVNLSQVDVAKVSVGNKVTLSLDAFTGKTFTGKVLLVDTNGQVSSGVTNYPATIVLDANEVNIYPNMSVTAKIIATVKNDVITVPTAALQTANNQSSVRILKNGGLATVPVEIGSSNDTQTEITSGIEEGDIVVTSVNTGGNRTAGSTSAFSVFGGARGFGGSGNVIRFGGR